MNEHVRILVRSDGKLINRDLATCPTGRVKGIEPYRGKPMYRIEIPAPWGGTTSGWYLPHQLEKVK